MAHGVSLNLEEYPGAAGEKAALKSLRMEQITSDLRKWSEAPIEFSFDPSGTYLFSIEELARAYAKRALDLGDSLRLLIEQGRIVPATILGRALIETIAMGCLFVHDINRLVAARDRNRLEERFKRFYAGVKGGSIPPVHVMDAMRHLEKIDGEYVEYLAGKYDVFSRALEAIVGTAGEKQRPSEMLSALKNYDALSEIAHPNAAGTQFLYPDPSAIETTYEKARERFKHASLMAIWQGHHLLNALNQNKDFAEKFRVAFLQVDGSYVG